MSALSHPLEVSPFALILSSLELQIFPVRTRDVSDTPFFQSLLSLEALVSSFQVEKAVNSKGFNIFSIILNQVDLSL